MLLCLSMLLCLGACGSKETASDENIVYGDETENDEFGDDAFVEGEAASNDAGSDKTDKNNSSKDINDKSSKTDKTNKNNKNNGVVGNEKGDGANDDDDVVTVTTSSSGNSGYTQEYDDGLKQKTEIDEDKKADFLSSVPAKFKDGKTEVTILIWWKVFDYELAKMKRFTDKTGIKVKFVYAADNYMQKLASYKAQGNAIDIACITPENFPSAIIQNYFKPIDDNKYGLTLDKKVYDLDSMNKLKWDGKRYGVMIKGNSHITMGMVMYNADLFTKYGVTDPHTLWQNNNWTWDTFVKTAQDIQNKAGITALSTEWHGYRLSQTTGEDAVILKNGKLVNNTGSETYREAYKFIYDLSLNGQYKVMDSGLNRDGFLDQKCAMFLEDSWALQSGERYEKTSFKIGYAPIPCKTKDFVVASDFQLWGFPDGSKDTEAASYALEYWLNPEYDEAGETTWVNESVAAFMDWLWGQPKNFKLSFGVIEYGGDYEWYEFNRQCGNNGNNISSVMDTWSNVIDENIRKIYLK